jgi:microcystin-dependent protein
MADSTKLGDDSTLKIEVPIKGSTNWADTLKEKTFKKIADHDHSGVGGKGAVISTVGSSAQDTTIKATKRVLIEKPINLKPGPPPASPSAGDLYVNDVGVLKLWNDSNDEWVDQSASASLSGAGDTLIVNPTDKQVLEYNSDSSNWIPVSQTISNLSSKSANELSDVDISTITGQAGQAPNWVSGQHDAQYQYKSGDMLVWDGQNQKFVPQSRAGEIVIFPVGPTIAQPQNSLICNGAALNRIHYPELFLILKYAYGGSGDTFYVPDYRGAFLRGNDQGSSRDTAGRDKNRGNGYTNDDADGVGTYQHSNTSLHNDNGEDGGGSNIEATIDKADFNHSHGISHTDAGKTSGQGDGGPLESANYRAMPPGAPTITIADSTLSGTFDPLTGGASETTPENVSVAYYIRYK